MALGARDVLLIGARVQEGLSQAGCIMGPAAYRTAGLVETLEALGCRVEDAGDLAPAPAPDAPPHPNPALKHLEAVAGWTVALQAATYEASEGARFPIILGGDHSLAMGALSGLSRRAAERGRPLFLLWLDAHPDIHTLDSTESGHLHGVPIAYLLGRPGFEPWLPPNPAPLAPERICMMGIRSVDPAERAALRETPITVHDMRQIDEFGVVKPLRAFLETVRAADGLLHVTLDVDFLDPAIAPGVNTTVPGGATFREAHLIMEVVAESGLCASLDLVELNPFLDDRGRTAKLMVDLAASLMGRQVLDQAGRRF
ncbi:MAG: arginase [Pseudomonadota bacterium]